ncbi:MAG: prepilin-type N-terminal cleavage/methylation domain-containing protein [Desulfonauticus sp.]|nr:prepilin-type N-terminal cleavage/methylation domain-containing protein [Desulfonauticus sp.]
MLKKNLGFTLIEIIIVIAILAILLGIAIPTFTSWLEKYKIEEDIKKISSFLQEGKMLAFTRKQDLIFLLNNKEACLQQNSINIKCIQLDTPFQTTSINIYKRGYFSQGSIVPLDLNKTKKLNPEYSCIVVSTLRVKIGEVNSEGTCDAK